MKLDLSPLGIAVGQLKEGLVLYDSDIVRQYQEIRGQMRAGAIQAFESICEVSVRMIQRYLEQVRLILRKVTGPNYGHLPDKQQHGVPPLPLPGCRCRNHPPPQVLDFHPPLFQTPAYLPHAHHQPLPTPDTS